MTGPLRTLRRELAALFRAMIVSGAAVLSPGPGGVSGASLLPDEAACTVDCASVDQIAPTHDGAAAGPDALVPRADPAQDFLGDYLAPTLPLDAVLPVGTMPGTETPEAPRR